MALSSRGEVREYGCIHVPVPMVPSERSNAAPKSSREAASQPHRGLDGVAHPAGGEIEAGPDPPSASLLHRRDLPVGELPLTALGRELGQAIGEPMRDVLDLRVAPGECRPRAREPLLLDREA